jgi:predicted transglutaminase-like cysteine proteinase
MLPRLSPFVPTLLLAATLVSWPSLAWDASRLQAAAQRLGPRAVAAVGPLQSMLAAARNSHDAARLDLVNQFFNLRLAFRPDIETWGRDDYWASPLESLSKGQGDCEDYAIGKYAALLASGVAPERLRLVYVRAQREAVAEPHMVLAYYPEDGAEPLILDNLRAEILPASKRRDLAPVFSFSAEGLWQGANGQRAGDPLARLSPWREVWLRTRAEGLP